MTLQGTDLLLMRTTTSGSSGSSTAQADATASLGKWASTTQVTSGAVGSVFDTVTAALATSGMTDYRCLAIRNASAVDAANNVVLWLADAVGGATYSVGLDPVGIVAYNSGSAQGTWIATKTTPPPGVTFSVPTDASPLAVGTIGANQLVLLWVKRVVPPLSPGTVSDTLEIFARAETT